MKSEYQTFKKDHMDDIKKQAPQGTTHYFTIGKRVLYLTKTNVKQRIGSKIFAFLFNVKPLN